TRAPGQSAASAGVTCSSYIGPCPPRRCVVSCRVSSTWVSTPVKPPSRWSRFPSPSLDHAGIPRVLATRFLKTNLRTYVRAADGEAGIYFFSLDASSLLAVSAARLLYGLPYFPASCPSERRASDGVFVAQTGRAR